MTRRGIAHLLALALFVLSGCGSGAGSGASTAGTPDLTVSAAASLKSAFTRYGQQFKPAHSRFSFAGSDLLAAQIQQGVRPDLFASANLKLPGLLYAQGLVEKPTAFAANRLVLAVPAGSSRIARLSDAETPGVTLAVGSPTVPIGAYTRTVLGRLGAAQRAKILANVRSEEPEVTGIVGKLTLGAVDGGFTYITDVRAAKGKLRAIALPATLQPVVAYGVAIVKGTAHHSQAQRFIAGLLRGAGRAELLRAGFLAPATR